MKTEVVRFETTPQMHGLFPVIHLSFFPMPGSHHSWKQDGSVCIQLVSESAVIKKKGGHLKDLDEAEVMH